MADKTVYPYGVGGQLPSNIGLVNDTFTGGADQALTAEAGKGLGNDVRGINKKLGETVVLELSAIPGAVMVNQVINSSNKWSAVSSDYVGYIVPVSPLDVYTIVGGANNQCVVAFLTSNDHTANATPAFSTQKSYSSRMTVASDVERDIPVPFDAAYMYVLVSVSGDVRLASISVYDAGIEQELHGDSIDQGGFYSFTGMISASNEWDYIHDYYVLIPISAHLWGFSIKFQANASNNSVYAFLSAPPITNGSTKPSFSSGGRVVVSANKVVTERIPDGTAWLYLYNQSANRFQSIEVLPPAKKLNNKGFAGLVEDTAFSWWTYPIAITTSGMKKKLINGWVDSSGNLGISVRDFFGGESSRTIIDKATVDDHNAPAVIELSDGRIAVVYSKGHNDTSSVYCRVSSEAGDYDHFESAVSVAMGAVTTYAQVFKIGTTYYIFTRTGTNNWSYTTTEDFETFTSPHTLITASAQHYVKFVPVADEPNIVRMVMYFNPTIAGNSIRLGYIDFDSGNVYSGSVNDENIVGTLTGSSISNTSFAEIIPSVYTNRLFDVAVSNLDTVIVAYSTFTLSDTTDSVYHIYENGNVTDLCHGGPFFYNTSGYMGGVSFRNKDEVVLARADASSDFIEIYERGNNGWERTRRVFDEKRGELPLRNIRPIFDTEGLFLLWQRGKYNPTSYSGFLLDIISALYMRF